MKSLAILSLASAVAQVIAASPEASVYLSDSSQQHHTKPPSISPLEARLLFAQRLGLSSYDSLGDVSDSTLELLNLYGGAQKQLFHEEQWQSPSRLLAIVEGVEHPEEITDSQPTLKIQGPPSSSDNLQLVSDLFLQDKHRRELVQDATRSGIASNVCLYELREDGKIGGGILGGHSGDGGCDYEDMHIQTDYSSQEQRYPSVSAAYLLKIYRHDAPEQTAFIHDSTLEGMRGAAYTEAFRELRTSIRQMLSLPNTQSTIIFMPLSSSSRKRSTYGSYTSSTQLTRRAQAPTEEPLSFLPTTSSQPSASAQNISTSPRPFTSVLPVCHATLESANAATRNCSGHGTAYKKYTTQLGENKEIDCFVCKCTKTVTTDSEGRTKTIYWGGPACQKKDISAQFWLLAGLGIMLAATVSWGVGLLFSIGEEELPSVIGAGVAGPRAQK